MTAEGHALAPVVDRRLMEPMPAGARVPPRPPRPPAPPTTDDLPRPSRVPRSQPRVGLVDFVRQVLAELRKVTWPPVPSVVQISMVVLAVVVMLTAAVGLFDLAAGTGLTELFSR
jgi:preprotein translocase SecE subunit